MNELHGIDLWRVRNTVLFMVPLTKQQRAAQIKAALERIAKSMRDREERQLATAAKRRKKGTT